MTDTITRDVANLPRHIEHLRSDGITALQGAFESAWADRMRDDMMSAFWKAIQRPGGAVGRGLAQFEERGVRKYPRRGDISARSAGLLRGSSCFDPAPPHLPSRGRTRARDTKARHRRLGSRR